MQSLTMEEALSLVQEANSISREELARLQEQRLADLIAHARTHSVLYGEKYAGLPEKPTLEMLPPLTKQELAARMKDWVTDPDFSEEELTAFIHDSTTLGSLFKDKYSVSTTSGTTGEPLKMLRDSRHVNINGAILQNRLFDGPLLKGLPDAADKRVKFASVLATGGHHAAFTAFEKRRTALAEEGITDTMLLLPIGEPIAEMVHKLNEFQPELMTGYPSMLHVLSAEQVEGRLNISPKVILCSAEQLTDQTRQLIEKNFQCPVGNVFCSTEGGEVAILCEHGKMHLNSDWVLVEPIDRAGRLVPPGTMSEAMLVTNLTNAVQPIIRYHVDDSIILHEERCSCGLPFPYIEVLGRSDDLPVFNGRSGLVRLSPLLFIKLGLEIEGLTLFQFIQGSPEELTMCVQYREGTSARKSREEALLAVRTMLDDNGLTNVSFSVEAAEPRRAARGKKMKTYIRDFT